jgi:hypothetical protein
VRYPTLTNVLEEQQRVPLDTYFEITMDRIIVGVGAALVAFKQKDPAEVNVRHGRSNKIAVG